MSTVAVTSEFGIVVRRAALAQRGVTQAALLQAMETSSPLDENEDLISFGPHFGGEAAIVLQRRLESSGLVYLEDFFVFVGDFPDWCRFCGYLGRGT